MAYTVTRTKSWLSRVGESIRDAVIGAVLILTGIGGLFWNEGRAVKTTQALEEGQSIVQIVEDNGKIDPAMEGKLVHMTGTAVTEDVVGDPAFGISHQGIKLIRSVKYYQWVESSHTEEYKNRDGSVTETTTYTYDKEWVDEPVNSKGFMEAGHSNTLCMPGLKKEEWQAQDVTFGAFKLNGGQISRVDNATSYSLAEYKAPENMASNSLVTGDELYVSWPPARQGAQQPNTADPDNPDVGDIRVSWSVVSPKEDVSLVAVQTNGTFGPYVAKRSGYLVDLFSCGTKSSDEMFQDAFRENTVMTWLYRLGGWVALFFGFHLLLKPISVILDVVPMIGNVAEVGLNVVSFFLASVIALVVIAVAWLFYRPVLGIVLLTMVAGLIVWYIRRKKTKTPQMQA